jgi:recombinational DNA repair protein (RecF pathway)
VSRMRVQREDTRHCLHCGQKRPTYYISIAGQHLRVCDACVHGMNHLIRRVDLEGLDALEAL